MIATGRGASEGLLIRNAEALETLASVDTLVLDKTGTVTQGKPVLTNPPPDELLQLAASVEQGSEHPLATTIVQAAKDRGLVLTSPADFQATPGRGAAGTVNGRRIEIGNSEIPRFADEARALSAQGRTVMFVSIDGQPQGILSVADIVKPSSRSAISALRADGLRIRMLTGDNRATAAVAKQTGIEEVDAEVLPDGKNQAIRDLQTAGRKVAMAGDGVNDAPALAQAEVGIAMGTGADLAM